MKSQAVEEDQEEQFKRRKLGDTLKGAIDCLFIKKKQLKNFRKQLEGCKKEMKEEKRCTKKLYVYLS